MPKKEVFYGGLSEENFSTLRYLQMEYFGFLEDTDWKKILFVLFLVALIAAFIFFKTSRATIPEEEKTISCGDGSPLDSCSLNKPYYCSDEGILFPNASACGCPDGMRTGEDYCISNYMKNPREVILRYFINGNESKINFTAYNGLVNYLSSLPEQISYTNGEVPSRADFKLRDISEKNQRELLIPLVVEIQNSAKTDVNQLRIAVSLVQNIEWGNSNKTGKYQRFGVGYSRYPYEVLYDSMGVCGEKSELLAFILKEMGYGVAIFYNAEENHESVGIKCPLEKSWHKTGYCFVETSGPAIISDSMIEYAGGVRISSKPETMILSEGKSLPKNMQEYEDAEFMMKIRNDLGNGGRIINPFRVWKYNELKKRYNIAGSYEIG